MTNDNNALFGTQPAIAANGTLTYTLAANANGVATVTVDALDNGGTANGGDATSGTQTFTITVTAVNDAPAFTRGANQVDARGRRPADRGRLGDGHHPRRRQRGWPGSHVRRHVQHQPRACSRSPQPSRRTAP